MGSIENVVDAGLCTGCGTCAGICPSSALEMQLCDGLWIPKLDVTLCNQCGFCVSACPGHYVNFEDLNSDFFGAQPAESSLGNYLECYFGHSTDKNIRYYSSSGGITTQILIFLLEEKLVDGVLVTRMKRDNPLESEPFIARTREEIISASKSKYCPVAANSALKIIMKEKGKFAVVGLPCHLHGLRKAEKLFPELREKIVLRLGLICAHTVNFFGTSFLIKKMLVEQDQIVSLDYRGEGWPGSMMIRSRKFCLKLPYLGGWNAYWPIFSSFFFTPIRCAMCPDAINELADISLGDAYLPELKHEKEGQSIIISRTDMGQDVLQTMTASKLISIESISSVKVKKSQASPLKFKKNDLSARLLIFNSMGKNTPRFYPPISRVFSPFAFVRGFLCIFNIKASDNRYIKNLLCHLPLPLFRLYFGVYKFLSSV